MTKWPENTSDCLPLPLQILTAHMQRSLVFTQIDNGAKHFTTLVTLDKVLCEYKETVTGAAFPIPFWLLSAHM